MKKRKKFKKINNIQNKDLTINIPRAETFLGFPVKKGMKNQLWTWDTLETVKF